MSARTTSRHLLLTALLSASISCGAEPPKKSNPDWQTAGPGVAAVSGAQVERFFPLVDGNLYHYRTESFGDGPRAETGMLMLKVRRVSATEGELRRPTGTQRFRYASNGVSTETKNGAPAFLLKWPLSPASTWLGPHGGKTHILASDVHLETEAGAYDGCVTTLEERRGDAPIRITTTLCPDVGIAALEVASGAAVERAKLVYYGPPVDIGAEGVKRVE